MDASGTRHKGVLTADDMANWSATIEAPLTYDYHGWTVAKIGPWGQGPVFLQTLSLLKGFDHRRHGPERRRFRPHRHRGHEARLRRSRGLLRRSEFRRCPGRAAAVRRLCRRAPEADRRPMHRSICARARIPGFEAQYDLTMDMLGATSKTGAVYEPTMAHLSEKRGDTVHIDVIDREGNMVSVTPSGGWLQSSPIVPGLGFCLNSRAQMFWLKPGLPTSLAPGKRPRTTLTPSLALHEGRPTLAFGTPGGDQQEQWQLSFFLRYVHHSMNLQEAIDQPLFHTSHFPGSFYPRTREPGSLMAEANFGTEVLDDLRRQGPQADGRRSVDDRPSDGRTSRRRRPDARRRNAAPDAGLCGREVSHDLVYRRSRS